MRSNLAAALSCVALYILVTGSARGSEVVVLAGKLVPVDDGLAVLCKTRDAANFGNYPFLKGTTSYVISLSWQMQDSGSVLMNLNEDQTSRMLLVAAGVSHPPHAIGTDNPPPPPPGQRPKATDHWTKVEKLLQYKGGGRFLFMTSSWPRDFLFELPAATGSPEAMLFRAIVKGKDYALRCDLRK